VAQGDGTVTPAPPPTSWRRQVNKFQNLLLQGAATLAGPDVDDVPLSERYIAFGPDGPQLRKHGSPDVTPYGDDALKELAADNPGQTLDLVFADESCIDLSFSLPDALLPEMRQIIENEVKYRSPFAEDACHAIWVGEEQTDGSWRGRAAVMLKANVDPVMAQIKQHDLKVGLVRRAAKGAAFAADPAWAGGSIAKPTRKGLRALPASLQLGLLGAAIFCASALAATVSDSMALSQTRTEADAARATLSAQAQSMATVRQLDTSLAQATDRLAMAGTLSTLLPDGVWLDQLIVDEDSVTVVGFAPSAAEITRLLSTLPQLSDIQFASPVTRDNTQNLERFRISATLSGAIK